MALRVLQRGLSPWLSTSLPAAAAVGCAAALPAALDRLCSGDSSAAVGSPCWVQQQQGQQLQQRCSFRSAPTFEGIDGCTTLEERRRQHLQRHTVTAAEAVQVGVLTSSSLMLVTAVQARFVLAKRVACRRWSVLFHQLLLPPRSCLCPCPLHACSTYLTCCLPLCCPQNRAGPGAGPSPHPHRLGLRRP